MAHDPTITAARSQRDAARVRMMATLDETKNRLSPATLAEHAVDGIKDKATTLASDGVTVARERPQATAAAAGGLLLFLARRPILGLIKRPFKRKAKAARERGSAAQVAPVSDPGVSEASSL